MYNENASCDSRMTSGFAKASATDEAAGGTGIDKPELTAWGRCAVIHSRQWCPPLIG